MKPRQLVEFNSLRWYTKARSCSHKNESKVLFDISLATNVTKRNMCSIKCTRPGIVCTVIGLDLGLPCYLKHLIHFPQIHTTVMAQPFSCPYCTTHQTESTRRASLDRNLVTDESLALHRIACWVLHDRSQSPAKRRETLLCVLHNGPSVFTRLASLNRSLETDGSLSLFHLAHCVFL